MAYFDLDLAVDIVLHEQEVGIPRPRWTSHTYTHFSVLACFFDSCSLLLVIENILVFQIHMRSGGPAAEHDDNAQRRTEENNSGSSLLPGRPGKRLALVNQQHRDTVYA